MSMARKGFENFHFMQIMKSLFTVCIIENLIFYSFIYYKTFYKQNFILKILKFGIDN